MKTTVLASVIAGLLGLSPCLAQNPVAERAQGILAAADWKTLTEARVDAVEAALQLTPEQVKLWPPVADAIRSRGQGRYMRLEALAASKSDHIDGLELLRGRADALAKRSGELNRLAEAWKPLYQTLSDDQKQRLRLLAVFALHEMRDAADAEQMKDIDFEDSEF